MTIKCRLRQSEYQRRAYYYTESFLSIFIRLCMQFGQAHAFNPLKTTPRIQILHLLIRQIHGKIHLLSILHTLYPFIYKVLCRLVNHSRKPE